MKKLAAIPLLALLFIGCSDDGTSTAPSPKVLYESDMATLRQASYSTSATRTSDLSSTFRKVFGGTSGYNVANFVDTRLAHVWNADDLSRAQLTPADLGKSKSWLNIDLSAPEANSNVQTIAENNGMMFWLIGKIEGKMVTVRNQTESITISNPREGIITLGKAYAPSKVIGYNRVALTPEYRLAIVVHEARHSDCTGGFPASYVQKARAASSFENFVASTGEEQLQCGHTHVTCPRFHDYSGHEACDKEAWGAYGIGAIYALGTSAIYPTGSIARELMEYSATDHLSRLIDVDDDEFLSSSPNLGSTHE